MDCCIFEGLDPDPLDHPQELQFGDIGNAITNKKIQRLGMVMLIGLKNNNIERLEQVGKIGGHSKG